MLTICCAVLDFSLCQPLQIRMPEGSKLLSVQYHNHFDHLYYIANPANPTEVREFVFGRTGSVFEPSDSVKYEYVGSTTDEESVVWHIFELIKTLTRIPVVSPLQQSSQRKKK